MIQHSASQDRSGLASAPAGALLFGFAGLLPFVVLALGIAFKAGNVAVMTAALQTYGAVTLSFLGGIRWGLAVRSENSSAAQYFLSILPVLVGWGAVFLSLPLAYAVLAVGFCFWFIVEIAAPKPLAMPHWHRQLRGVLTFGAALSLIVAAIFW